METVLNVRRQRIILQQINQEQTAKDIVRLCSLLCDKKKKNIGFLVTDFGVKYILTVSLTLLRKLMRKVNIYMV